MRSNSPKGFKLVVLARSRAIKDFVPVIDNLPYYTDLSQKMFFWTRGRVSVHIHQSIAMDSVIASINL